MVERKFRLINRVDTEEVQGTGSYVVLKRMTWEEYAPLLEEGKESDFRKVASEFLPKVILEWNWVDDDGNPLPLPKDNPEIVKKVPMEELNFLVRQTSNIRYGMTDGQKN